MSRRILIHPAAEIAPPLEGEAFDAFCEVVKRFGLVEQLDPILAVRVPEADGKINGTISVLSGQTMLKACKHLGLEPKIAIHPGSDVPAELVASLNMLRPHPDASQRAAAGVHVEARIAVEARKRQSEAGGDRRSLLVNVPKAKGAEPDDIAIHARASASRIVGVSSTYIGRAKIIHAANPQLFRDLETGQIALGRAFSKVKLDKKRKANAAAAGPLEKPRDNKGLTGIREGDCLKILPLLPRRKFRLVFADPPYNIGIDYGDGSKADHLPRAEYLRRMEQWIEALPDLLTPDGTAWVMINNEWAAEFVLALKRTGMKMRGWIKWYETFGNNCQNNFNRTSRHLLYFVRDPKQFVFNAEIFSRPSDRQTIYGDKRANPTGKLWDDVWTIPRLVSGAERLPDFPTQLPLELVRPIVAGCSEPGDLVLDPFSGSGTTAAACAMTGRQCLGIEINPQYAAWSRARIAAIGAKP
jgi:site-specific DNA-methyltransferase (adenine-specific)